MGSLIFKSHFINYAVSPKSTHYDTRSYDIISVFLLKLLDILWGMGRIIESFVVQCIPAYLCVQCKVQFFCLNTKGSTVDILYRVPLLYSLRQGKFHKNEQLFYFLSDSYDILTQSSSDYLHYE